MKLAAYIRVSTDLQGTKGHSLADQERQIKAWADSNGHVIVAVHQDIVSSRNLPKLRGRDQAIADAESGACDGVVVKDLDRFSRSILDGITQFHRAISNRWALLTLDGCDSTDPEKELITNIKLSVAQEERRKISKRTKAGLAQARAEGKTLGRPRKVEADVVDRIMADHKLGKSQSAIARELTEEGIKTPAGAVKWYPATVRDVVMRES